MNRLLSLIAMMGMSGIRMATNDEWSNPIPQKHKPNNKGMKIFIFDDGFECWALNQNNANKKHKNQP